MTDKLSETKGPAEAATSPSHGSNNPGKEKEMNTAIDTIVTRKKEVHTGSDRDTRSFDKQTETAAERVKRLTAELSEALDEHADKRFHAVVYPSTKRKFPIAFVVTDSCNDVKIPIEVERLDAEDRALWHLKRASQAMREVSGKSLWYVMQDDYMAATIYAAPLLGDQR
ncbi:hypothetical protein [Mycoplana rhizolycopersici]|uniref:Reverse transcriptase/retrotransposon-derived protein RNase H-like domain-containing protein n=1 Tax=Mycoplana rhizolycopersici TaxID=2746702 RepID=A0ABX2QDZ1_9HYPH|nr:hypothetical protein [Rhizobium rhizolycopersici]NVP55986.1 hypothetical protein [Rhizobium rhizolycopersici]